MEKPLKLNKIPYILWVLCLCGCELKPDKGSVNNYTMLKNIDTNVISVVAPASWVEDDEAKILEENYPTLWCKINYQYEKKYDYLSNTDEQRFKYFKEAFKSKKSSTIWTLRGGYGSQRIIPLLLKMPQPSVHKWLIGYSDITALHLFVSQVWGWKSIHGSVLKEIIDVEKDPKNFQFLEKILLGSSEEITYSGLKLVQGGISQPITGKLTGGNTALLSTSIGTLWQISAKGKIVIIEESGHGDRVDRILQHLKQTKLLETAVAIIIGDIITWDVDNQMIINDFIKDLKMPIFKTDIFGHGYKNYPWIYNAKGVIESDASGDYQLTFSTH
jgi:muramoyltetrapeptide carboxypeptidase